MRVSGYPIHLRLIGLSSATTVISLVWRTFVLIVNNNAEVSYDSIILKRCVRLRVVNFCDGTLASCMSHATQTTRLRWRQSHQAGKTLLYTTPCM